MQFQNGRVDRGIHRKGDIAIAPAGLSKWQWEGEDRYLGFSFTTSFIEKLRSKPYKPIQIAFLSLRSFASAIPKFSRLG
ncbi:MAG: hypothetical protein HC847_02920 [Hydrococcus sp. RU_2_2]|nr:hypothetical protein [Hydrococcus sp. RU_2_2]